MICARAWIRLAIDFGKLCIAGCFVFFFFQAEDGIRDLYVTGVQTCALPISFAGPKQLGPSSSPVAWPVASKASREPITRSEERRVGKSVDLGGRRIIKK